MIVAGGTGGHVYPGIAVADELHRMGIRTHWLGSRHGIEARVVAGTAIPLSLVRIRGLRRGGWLRWLTAPFIVALATAHALIVMIKIRPSVVLGMGGFVSGPGGVAAWLCRKPLVIHEQNAVPGLTNRLLSRIATRVLEAFPRSFPVQVNARCTGNPVRDDIASVGNAGLETRSEGPLNLLVFGGSRGARKLNRVVPAALSLAQSTLGQFTVLHQCGADMVEETRVAYREAGFADQVEIQPYIDDMASAYSRADLVIARAGALTIAELAASGKPSILIPYPHAVDDHQALNARYLTNSGAAVSLDEPALTATTLAQQLSGITANQSLAKMSAAALELGRPQATQDVAHACVEVLDAS